MYNKVSVWPSSKLETLAKDVSASSLLVYGFCFNMVKIVINIAQIILPSHHASQFCPEYIDLYNTGLHIHDKVLKFIATIFVLQVQCSLWV